MAAIADGCLSEDELRAFLRRRGAAPQRADVRWRIDDTVLPDVSIGVGMAALLDDVPISTQFTKPSQSLRPADLLRRESRPIHPLPLVL